MHGEIFLALCAIFTIFTETPPQHIIIYMPEKIPRKSNMTYYGGMYSLIHLELCEDINLFNHKWLET